MGERRIGPGEPVHGDFLGSGREQIGVFFRGTWLIDDGSQTVSILYRELGDVGVPGRYLGAGSGMLIAVWRPSNGTWYVRRRDGSTVTPMQWGQPGDALIPDDYDGTGMTIPAVYRSSDRTFYIGKTMSGQGEQRAIQFGAERVYALSGDFTGLGRAQPAVWHAGTGMWYAAPDLTVK